MKSCLKLNATMVANEFIDRYMAGANGEYVKVYLYILRHEGQVWDAGQIADDLNHTESDVRRAIGYWIRQGVLKEEPVSVGITDADGGGSRRSQEAGGLQGLISFDQTVRSKRQESVRGKADTSGRGTGKAEGPGIGDENVNRGLTADMRKERPAGPATKEHDETSFARAAAPQNGGDDRESGASLTAAKESAAFAFAGQDTPSSRKIYTPEQVSRLAGREDFTQLLYIAQKYMDKIFTPRECEVFAYLYDALHMPAELLEYLVEYCVQNGHSSIRYLESVAINWHEKGFGTVDEAKAYTATFSKEGFAVMRAFGISDRRPGDSEQDFIRKWFREFGFTKDIVLEACSRTLKAIHKPSFSYADKILSDWKKGGVRVMADIQKMDQQRERDNKRGGRTGAAVRPAKNQFHNFEQRDTDYDAMVLERLKERLGDS